MNGPDTWPTTAYAGFWRRFGGYLIDVIIFQAAGFFLGLLAGFAVLAGGGVADDTLTAIFSVVGAVAYAIYDVTMTSRFGWTVGKRAVNVEVRTGQGELPSVGVCIGRFFARILSALPLLLGYLWAGWDAKKQTWHDKIVGTYVLKREVLHAPAPTARSYTYGDQAWGQPPQQGWGQPPPAGQGWGQQPPSPPQQGWGQQAPGPPQQWAPQQGAPQQGAPQQGWGQPPQSGQGEWGQPAGDWGAGAATGAAAGTAGPASAPGGDEAARDEGSPAAVSGSARPDAGWEADDAGWGVPLRPDDERGTDVGSAETVEREQPAQNADTDSDRAQEPGHEPEPEHELAPEPPAWERGTVEPASREAQPESDRSAWGAGPEPDAAAWQGESAESDRRAESEPVTASEPEPPQHAGWAAPGAAPAAAAHDPNLEAIRRAGLNRDSTGWLEQVATQVEPRLDRINPGWREQPQHDAARACAFGLLLGHLGSIYPHMEDDIGRVAEAHPSFSTLLEGSRLATLQQIAQDPGRATAWLGPLIDVDDRERVRRLLE
ncbi:hypothetical protein BH23ACT8_BH23ACT8_18880 [soil metagenome]